MLVGVLGLVAILLVIVNNADLLGVRILKKSNTRITVSQGERVTLQITALPSARKIEICSQPKVSLTGKNSTQTCKPLVNVFPAKQTKVNVVIPANFPVGRAFIQSRVRGKNNVLVNMPPVKENINVLVKKAVVAPPVSQESSGGGGSGGGNSGGSSGGGGGGSDSGSNSQANNSPSLTQKIESDGRIITIYSDHSELIAGETNHIIVTYAINRWPGSYRGKMQVFVDPLQLVTDVTNISAGLQPKDFYSPWGQVYLEWPYVIVNGNSQSFSFDFKVPPKGYKGKSSITINAQNADTYGPQYLNSDGTAPEGPIDVHRAIEVTLPIK